jgi:hypothetical protein
MMLDPSLYVSYGAPFGAASAQQMVDIRVYAPM